MIDLAATALRVHQADWRVKTSEGHFGRGEATLIMRGGLEEEHLAVAVDLAAYVKAAGEISTRLLRPADGVVIGKIVELYESNRFDLSSDDYRADAVNALTAILRGEGA
jgi:hypothetical protein